MDIKSIKRSTDQIQGFSVKKGDPWKMMMFISDVMFKSYRGELTFVLSESIKMHRLRT